MLQAHLSPRETASRVRQSWLLETISLVARVARVLLGQHRVARLSSFDPSYKPTAEETYPRLSESRPGGLPGHDPTPATVGHRGVYHRGTDVTVAEACLDGADVIPSFQVMGGKDVPRGGAGSSLAPG
jgi:hypothetical protein